MISRTVQANQYRHAWQTAETDLSARVPSSFYLFPYAHSPILTRCILVGEGVARTREGWRRRQGFRQRKLGTAAVGRWRGGRGIARGRLKGSQRGLFRQTISFYFHFSQKRAARCCTLSSAPVKSARAMCLSPSLSSIISGLWLLNRLSSS